VWLYHSGAWYRDLLAGAGKTDVSTP